MTDARPDPPGALDLTTELLHHGYRAPASFDAVPVGVHKASTILFKDTAALHARDWRSKDGYTYGLHGTPTTFTLEERLNTLEGGRHTLLAPSGLAAIAMVDFALLRSGDEVLLPNNVYGPSRVLAANELAAWGVTHRLYDPLDAASLAALIGPQTRLVWLEAAGSVTMEFPDLRGLIAVCRARGVTVALDDTWGAGLAYCGFELDGRGRGGPGADIVVHALTKYPSGGADVLMGSVTTRDAALHQRIAGAHMRLGLGVGANDVEAVLRGLPSLDVRYAAQDRAARTLAEWWAQRPEAAAVLHPALPGAPGHAHWRSVCNDRAAGLFSVQFDARYAAAQVDAFVDALRLFKIGYSWGGPVSLVVPYEVATMRADTAALPGHLVRFSIGLEGVADLQADLEQALSRLD
jgi:cystathionine beta-lyase